MKKKIRAAMATYPGRGRAVVDAVTSISSQVDEVLLVANEYSAGNFFSVPNNVKVIFPETDLKDTGKFCGSYDDQDYVILCDDDIIYPEDYVDVMLSKLEKYSGQGAIVGVHGVIYSDFFDGDPGSRIVHVFSQGLKNDVYVNQLGTGTVACRGSDMPSLEFMVSSARFVDVRFAAHCHRLGLHRVCIAREAGWMKEISTGVSLFDSFTITWPSNVTAEAQEIGGLRFLPALFPG
ncbi:MAG: hypothetical protein U1E62_22475 [Alsobacter sp.]